LQASQLVLLDREKFDRVQVLAHRNSGKQNRRRKASPGWKGSIIAQYAELTTRGDQTYPSVWVNLAYSKLVSVLGAFSNQISRNSTF
jgi:hypothetical protein